MMFSSLNSSSQTENMISKKFVIWSRSNLCRLPKSNTKKIRGLIRKQDWSQINEVNDLPSGEFREYLDIIRFKDQNDKQYVATIYDSDELFQDPQIIDIFLL